MVRFAALVLLLCSSCNGLANELSLRREDSNLESTSLSSSTIDSRELFLADLIPNPIGSFCENVELEWNILLGFPINSGIVCTCSGSIFPPSIGTKCVNKICAPADIVCVAPALKVGFDLLNLFSLKLPLTAAICLTGIEIVGLELTGELCFDFFNPITGLFGGFFSSRSSRASPSNFSACSVTVDGNSCDVCQLCTHSSGGTGVIFGCPGFESVGCTLLSSEPLPTETKMAINVDSINTAPMLVAT